MDFTTSSIQPSKTREIRNHQQDSTVWNDISFRDDDIIIATYGKSGTTWMQQIIAQLIHAGDSTVEPGVLSPWVELRDVPRDELLGMLEAQTHRRFMKTHLPADAMVWNSEIKYIFVGRDGRDVIWSCWHHFAIATPLFWEWLNDTPGRVGPPVAHPPEDPRDLFLDLLEDDTRPTILWPFWSHIRSWWAMQNQPNVLLVHFADLKQDLEGEMRRIAAFLQIPNMSEDDWRAAIGHCKFDFMKEHAKLYVPPSAEIAFQGGAKSFINKGTNGRWRDVLSGIDNERYLEKAREELGDDCAKWLEKGRLA